MTGQKAPSTGNVDNAKTKDTLQMKAFENGWPESFNTKLNTTCKLVRIQVESRKAVKMCDEKSFDTELIYIRDVEIKASGRDIDVNNVLSFKLA